MHVYFYHRGFPATDKPIHMGVSKAVAGLAGGLVANGARVTILTEHREANEFVSDNGYQILSFERTDVDNPDDKLNFSLAPALRTYLKDHKSDIDVIIINGMFYKPLTQIGSVLRNLNIPYIVAPHDPFHPSLFESKRLTKWFYWHLFEKRMLEHARAIQILDERHEAWLQRRDIHRPVIVTPNGFDSDNLPHNAELSWFCSKELKLIFLGRLDVHNKGLDLLLKALAVVETEFSLTLQGPNQDGATPLRVLADKLGLGDKVSIKTPDYSKSSTQIMADYDVFCLPSRFEGFGLAALEAMLTARVVLVSDIAGIAPHVRTADCGVTVEPTPQSICAGLKALLARKSEWRDMGLRGRNYALKHLHWNEIAAKALAEYEKVLS